MQPLTKLRPSYRTDEGQDVPAQPMYSWTCICGQRCGVWYPHADRAEASYDRHLGRVALHAEAVIDGWGPSDL